MRYWLIVAATIIASTITACPSVQKTLPTPEPLPEPTYGKRTITPVATWTPQATYMPYATQTPYPTYTAQATYTPYPTLTPLVATGTVYAWHDQDGSNTRSPGEKMIGGLTLIFMHAYDYSKRLIVITPESGVVVVSALPGCYQVIEQWPVGWEPFLDNPWWVCLSLYGDTFLGYRAARDIERTPTRFVTKTPTVYIVPTRTLSARVLGMPVLLLPVGYADRWGWPPNLDEVRGLRCGKRLRECGEVVK